MPDVLELFRRAIRGGLALRRAPIDRKDSGALVLS
jgi:hypothetical protein